MKKTICLILAFSLFICPITVNADGVQNWYIKYPKEGGRPVPMDGSALPDEYGALYMGNPEKPVIYLTFDAGYGNENVDSILDTLKKHEVNATFFILPAILEYNLPTVERMIADGHLIGNHSYSHRNMGAVSDLSAFKEELEKAEKVFFEKTGKEMTKFFRPPEGAFSEKMLCFCRELGYTPVFWSFAYADWDNGKQPDLEYAKNKILSTAHNGEIMLLHPNSATNAAILDEVITELKAEGYSFGQLTDICR